MEESVLAGKQLGFGHVKGEVMVNKTFTWKCLQRGKLRITIIRHKFIFIST